jgi:hypothetical protein
VRLVLVESKIDMEGGFAHGHGVDSVGGLSEHFSDQGGAQFRLLTRPMNVTVSVITGFGWDNG